MSLCLYRTLTSLFKCYSKTFCAVICCFIQQQQSKPTLLLIISGGAAEESGEKAWHNCCKGKSSSCRQYWGCSVSGDDHFLQKKDASGILHWVRTFYRLLLKLADHQNSKTCTWAFLRINFKKKAEEIRLLTNHKINMDEFQLLSFQVPLWPVCFLQRHFCFSSHREAADLGLLWKCSTLFMHCHSNANCLNCHSKITMQKIVSNCSKRNL